MRTTKRREHMRRRFGAAAPRLCAMGVTVSALAGVLCFLFFAIRTVTVRDSAGAVHTLRSAYGEAGELLRVTGTAVGPNDAVSCMTADDGAVEIFVRRAFPVSVQVDGALVTEELSGGTVADLLARAGVTLGPDDEVSPAPGADIYEGMEPVRVTRVTYEEQRAQRVVPHTVEHRDDTETTQGRYIHEEQVSEGRDGLVETVYLRRYEDGRYAGTENKGTQVITQMEPEVYRTFRTDALSMVPAPLGITVENNVPSSYTTMYSMRSTGYWSPRGRGASGLGLYCGTFACDPNVIPYGTKVYIASPDGSFVYGWAIATDTGAFALSNPMQIDLFYESYAESAAHGVKQVNVYIP